MSRFIHQQFSWVCLCFMLVVGICGCSVFAPAVLPPPAEVRLTPEVFNAVVKNLPTFESASALIRLQRDPRSQNIFPETRLGVLANNREQLRLDVYPSIGFVSTLSAVISPQRVVAVNRLEKWAIESEQVNSLFTQISGIQITPSDLSLAVFGKFSSGFQNVFSAAYMSLNGSEIRLRDAKNRFEVQLQNNRVIGLQRISNDGARLDIQRLSDSQVSLVITSRKDVVTTAVTLFIDKLLLNNVISEKLFTISTEGYKTRRRLN